MIRQLASKKKGKKKQFYLTNGSSFVEMTDLINDRCTKQQMKQQQKQNQQKKQKRKLASYLPERLLQQQLQ